MSDQRKKKKLATRELIKLTAKASFSEKGIAATNTRFISKACGLAVGTFFSHFPDKLSLVKELFFEDMDTALKSASDATYVESSHPVIFFEFYADILFRFYGSHIEATHLVLMDSLLKGGFFTKQMQVLQAKAMYKYCSVGVDERVAQVFCENIVSNFLHVLLSELASSEFVPDNAKQKLSALNKPFSISYQSAVAANTRHL
ncbi:TetR/AcrR family transcriptional regulator [Marinomonas algicola]|uniref:TetR/AcrR family transcriptional regulator n=1 Tax=Marinomonas algicola TaxID=2773454 RepID=UPI00174EA82C|nr:TetR/AcrR family transcriptional regulator [Marinomonas algicola]